MAQFVVVAGMSGAGRSQVGIILEDLGWFVIDNLPPSLVPKVAELAQVPGSDLDRIALVVGPTVENTPLLKVMGELRSGGADVRLVFLEADTATLVRRYESSRRRHPQATDGGLTEAIEAERAVLRPLKAAADLVVDTTGLSVHNLRRRLGDGFAPAQGGPTVLVSVTSFAYTKGAPSDVDVVIDCRYLPNPHWVEELRDFDGRDPRIQEWLRDQPITDEAFERLKGFLATAIPGYLHEGRAYLNLAMGCTGGKHRSVAMAEWLSTWLRGQGYTVRLGHRELDA
ncbi:MAG: RNase adapter RapZ [Microthrixaceae bacterium]